MNIRIIKQSDMMKCPHFIMIPNHYRDDGTCKCNDKNETVMAEWGYVWSDEKKRWDISDYETTDFGTDGEK